MSIFFDKWYGKALLCCSAIVGGSIIVQAFLTIVTRSPWMEYRHLPDVCIGIFLGHLHWHLSDKRTLERSTAMNEDNEWRPDRLGQYWCRWPGWNWTVVRYNGIMNGQEVWENDDRPPEVGPLAVPPSTLVEAASAEDDGWRPTDTAPSDDICYWWLEWADDIPQTNPPLPWTVEARLFHGRNRCWPSIYKAIYWHPFSTPPVPSKGDEG